MSAGAFVAGDWVDRLVTALAGLAKAQERFLQEYWQHNPRKHVVIDGRDVTPFPLDDLRMVYARFGTASAWVRRSITRPCARRWISRATLSCRIRRSRGWR